MGLIRFIVGTIGFGLMVYGTVTGIRGFWEVSKGDPEAWKTGLVGISAVIVGGLFLLRPITARIKTITQGPPKWDEPAEPSPLAEVGTGWEKSDVLRFVGTVLALALVIGGTLSTVLGLWGMTRGSFDGWLQAIAGTIAAICGGALLLSLLHRLDEPRPPSEPGPPSGPHR